ncbi:PLP-dependent transferase [Westerdykella ornata]|uniref:PLP-dependent transferase n=1 Tax=Westerdykella ornata TaxID=318751 RepID=A0A6A6JDX9_WESOR|nr:PLP-dependent transferase [Westerdykella ornata]KAF2274622.1 PLP-dependent transferase [Westerdykella ornata]
MTPSPANCPNPPNVASNSTSRLLFGRLHHPGPLRLRQKGNWQYFQDGTKFFDASGTAATACLGFGDKRLLKAKRSQETTAPVADELIFRTPVVEELARRLIESTDGKMDRVGFYSSGSENNEAGVKLARQYQFDRGESQRDWIIARKRSYHGNTITTLSISGYEERQEKQKPLFNSKVSYVSACYEYRDRRPCETIEEFVERHSRELDAEFKRVGPERVIAFICEPVSGAALACAKFVPGYLNAMHAVCKKYGALMIVDEIMCGAGRCGGTYHVWQKEEGFVPDIQTMGKSFSGGHAVIGAVLVSRRVSAQIEGASGMFLHGHTFQAEPSACAVALETMRIVEPLLPRVEQLGVRLLKGLYQRLKDHPNVGDIRGEGCFLALEFVKDKATKEPFDRGMEITDRIFEKGISDYQIRVYKSTGFILPSGRGDAIILAPAFNISNAVADYIVDKVCSLVEDFFHELENPPLPLSPGNSSVVSVKESSKALSTRSRFSRAFGRFLCNC